MFVVRGTEAWGRLAVGTGAKCETATAFLPLCEKLGGQQFVHSAVLLVPLMSLGAFEQDCLGGRSSTGLVSRGLRDLGDTPASMAWEDELT